MGELVPAELIILRPEHKQLTGIDDMRRRLSDELRVPMDRIRHAVDGKNHSQFGHVDTYVAMREKDRPNQNLVLVAVKPTGQEVVPHIYLGSRPHLTPKSGRIFIHFYLIEQKHAT